MSALNIATARRHARREHGFTLVELMVTVAIALFLLGGLFSIVQNLRKTYSNQQALALLQDQQRFAMTVITDVIQAAGYFPNATSYTDATSLTALAPFGQGQAFAGSHPGGAASDTLGVRYRTAIGDGVILCDGSTNTTVAPDNLYANQFTVVPPATPPTAAAPGTLYCQLNNNAPLALVTGIQSMTIYYGVKRDAATDDYNVDTYLTADQMDPAGPLGSDWANVSSVRVVLSFVNPLYPQPGQQQYIQFERVVEVMGRAGVHT
jgi:type IV pilus assembly protein PilW